MPYPRQLQRYNKIQLSETTGPDPSVDGRTGGDITTDVADYTLPDIVLATERHAISGGKGSLPIPFGVAELQFALNMKGVLACIIGLGNTRPTFIVTEYLYSQNAAAGAIEDQFTVTVAGNINSIPLAQIQNQADQRPAGTRGIVMDIEVLKVEHSNSDTPLLDIDIPNDVYNFFGRPMFPTTT